MLKPIRAKAKTHPYISRLLITLIFSTLFVALFNEVTYWLQKEDFDRLPKTIQLVIPAGTAEKVAAGASVPSIPEEMVFVIGDVLEVRNEDTQAHQLGPLWIPSGGTARLAMEEPNRYSYACTFQPSKYLGLDVRKGTTLATRITALLLAAPTMGALIFIYSLAAYPIKNERKKRIPGSAETDEARIRRYAQNWEIANLNPEGEIRGAGDPSPSGLQMPEADAPLEPGALADEGNILHEIQPVVHQNGRPKSNGR